MSIHRDEIQTEDTMHEKRWAWRKGRQVLGFTVEKSRTLLGALGLGQGTPTWSLSQMHAEPGAGAQSQRLFHCVLILERSDSVEGGGTRLNQLLKLCLYIFL